MMQLAVVIWVLAVAVATSVLWWNGFFYVVVVAAIIAIAWPELPGRIARWLDR